jgi:hypothetical protein
LELLLRLLDVVTWLIRGWRIFDPNWFWCCDWACRAI